ncbi:MAG: protein TolR [Desulfocapsaceae bacterium]|nr:protein TolR [Desulfocapsaceae bacterium]
MHTRTAHFSKQKNGRKKLVSDINVTPLVDVMLVLLIIFMVTAPMMNQGLDVDLPETTTKSLRQKEEPIIVSIDKKGTIMLDKIEVTRPLLKQQLQKSLPAKKEHPIYLKADKDVAYGLVVGIMADIKESGFDKLGMITQPPINER